MQCRLDGAAQALSGGGSDGMLTSLSLVHAKAVKALINATHLTDEDKASLSAEIRAVPWRGEDYAIVMDSLLQIVETGAAVKLARKPMSRMQDLRAVVDYWTAANWEDLLDQNVGFSATFDMIVEKVVSFGFCPCEHTKKLLIEFLLKLTGTNTNGLTHEMKKQLKVRLTASVKRLAKTHDDPLVYLVRLPAPHKLHQDHPEFYEQLFPDADHPPVPCQLCMKTIMGVDASVNVRGSALALLPQQGVPVLNLSTAPTQTNQMEAFGAWMMKGMEQMAATQSKVFELLLGGQGNARERSLGAMKDLSTPPRRCLTIPELECETPAQGASHRALVMGGGVPTPIEEAPRTACVGSRQQLALADEVSADLGGGGVKRARSPSRHHPDGRHEQQPTTSTDAAIALIRQRRHVRQAALDRAKQSAYENVNRSKRVPVGSVILEMIKERSQEAAEAKKGEGKSAKAKAKLGLAGIPSKKPSPQKKTTATAVTPIKHPLRTPPPAGPTTRSGSSLWTPPVEGRKEFFDKPLYTMERSRSQVIQYPMN